MKHIISAAAEPRAARNYFARACFARAQGGIRKTPFEAFLDKNDTVSRQIINRAAVDPATTTGVGWAAELGQDAFPGFLASLKPYSAAARIIAGAVPVTLGVHGEAKFPTRAAGPVAPQWVGEGDAIPISTADFSLIEVGPKRKIAAIIPWSMELSKRSDAAAIFERMLREDVAAGLDAAMLSTAGGSASVYAGLLNGVTAGEGYAGADRTAIDVDLMALGEAVATSGSGAVLYIMAPERLARLRIKAPDLVAALDLAASAAVPASRVIAVEPSAIVSAVDPMPDLDWGPQATVHMSDVPLEIVSDTGPTTADPVRSLWQTASTALRIIYDLAWAKRRTGAVAYLDGATW